MDSNDLEQRLDELSHEHGREPIERTVALTRGAVEGWLAQTGSTLTLPELPGGWAGGAERAAPADSPEQLASTIAARTGLREGLALELVQTLGQYLSATAGHDELDAARERMPAAWGSFFGLPPSESAPPAEPRVAHAVDPSDRTLGGGTSPSRNPIGTTSAPQGHRQSIARSENPRSDVKLASADGTRRDQRGDTLSRGAPRSRNPVSGGKE